MGRSKRAASRDGSTPEAGYRMPIMDAYQASLITTMMNSRVTARRLQTLLSGSPQEAPRWVRDEIQSQREQAEESWDHFVEHACVSDAERNALRAMGQPAAIELDGDASVVVAAWHEPEATMPGVWPTGLTLAIASNESQFLPTFPFRVVRTEALAPGTRFIKITDPLHAATATLDALLRAIVHDVDVHIRRASGRSAWLRLANLVGFYNSLVKKILMPGLRDDEFQGWHPDWKTNGLVAIPAAEMPRIVDGAARTCAAQRLVAAQLVADMLSRAMEDAERDFPEADEAKWAEMTVRVLDQSAHVMAEAIRGYNIALMAFAGANPENCTAMTVLRSEPPGLPVVAVIPRGQQVRELDA